MHTTTAATPSAAATLPAGWVLDLFTSSAAACESRAHPIRRGDTWVVDRPEGQAVICTEGTLWITHEQGSGDHIVEEGGRYVASHGSRMLVHAMSDSKVQIVRV